MPLVNLENLVVLGPGSEWLWTFIQAIALTITFVAIYRQLRAARSASEFEQVREIEGEFNSARMTLARLALFEGIRDRKPAQGLPDGALEVVCWYDNLGYLVEAGHLSRTWFHESWGESIQNEWWLIEPYLLRERAILADPGYGKSFERLVERMRRLDAKSGQTAVTHADAERPVLIARYIRILVARLRFAVGAMAPQAEQVG